MRPCHDPDGCSQRQDRGEPLDHAIAHANAAVADGVADPQRFVGAVDPDLSAAAAEVTEHWRIG